MFDQVLNKGSGEFVICNVFQRNRIALVNNITFAFTVMPTREAHVTGKFSYKVKRGLSSV